MRKFIVCSLIVFISGLLQAQNSPQTGSPSPTVSTRTSLTPAASPKTQKSAAQSVPARQAPSLAPATPSANPGAQSRSGQSTGSASYARTNLRPSASASGAKTARSVGDSGKKVAPLKAPEPIRINWMTIEQAIEKNKTEKRKIYIDVYTGWCGWCKHMDSTTFITPAVAQYLNDHYYPVKFNAEQQQDIAFKDKTYRFKRDGARGYHELAAEWLNNRLSFPTSVFLDENLNTIQPLGGYLDATKMEAILNYFGTDSHRTTPWETYERRFANNKAPGNN
jgi:thioredoxin-related protein